MSSARDRGGIAVIYALSFLFLVTLVGLSIDIGATFAKRQEAQNAADAAAVAVAAQCLVNGQATNCNDDYGAARAIALDNERADSTMEVQDGDIYYETPEPYHVTVVVTGHHDSWFLPATTNADSFTVKRKAVVNYGSPVYGTSTLPVAGSECVFPDDPPEPDASIPIELWLPQNATQANSAGECNPDFPAGGFGWLSGEDCTAEIGVDNTVPNDPGSSAPSGCDDKDEFKSLADANTIVFIPLFAVSEGSGGNAVYTVTRFAVFEFTGFHSQQGFFNDSAAEKRCTHPPDWVPTNWSYNTTTCFKGNLLGYEDDLGDFELGGPITELTYTRLVG